MSKEENKVPEFTKEELIEQKEEFIKTVTLRVQGFTRDLNSKKAQIKSGESLEKYDGYVDGKKPIWMLENDCDLIQAQIDEMNKAIDLNKADLEKLKAEEEPKGEDKSS